MFDIEQYGDFDRTALSATIEEKRTELGKLSESLLIDRDIHQYELILQKSIELDALLNLYHDKFGGDTK